MIAGALAVARAFGHDGTDVRQTRRLPSPLALQHQDTDGVRGSHRPAIYRESNENRRGRANLPVWITHRVKTAGGLPTPRVRTRIPSMGEPLSWWVAVQAWTTRHAPKLSLLRADRQPEMHP